MFEIVLNHPHIEDEKSLKEYKSIGELIENIFPLSEDYFYINWNHIYVSLSYKYDLSIVFEDFIYIYKFLESYENNIQMTFPSNTFDVMWNIKKDGYDIIIESQWNTILSHNENILNENSFLKINLSLFKKEISKILEFIYKIFIRGKGNIDDQLLSDILDDKPTGLD
ncbi:hypothetical protein [Chryseobacterium rhizosphaerae]|uniref:Uncharacterized protein n=1 Tax=Chryseobacterium rhizosphaerae TaxID=395937 RepID=A0ABX9IGG0_9FLAO|nr:hypothetical protein [Chryseobacterium rhizosphaerae]MDR6545182.1 hypothetical protein [Chryseobacterium rhizosphaerae]REC73108.1 hypothetical protein DRF57_18130 [Chryseobacterium rhizosphaerae]GEN67722.1 hypothetical protein CRH01_22900 [Chryseobacterium rhizosphaerae]